MLSDWRRVLNDKGEALCTDVIMFPIIIFLFVYRFIQIDLRFLGIFAWKAILPDTMSISILTF